MHPVVIPVNSFPNEGHIISRAAACELLYRLNRCKVRGYHAAIDYNTDTGELLLVLPDLPANGESPQEPVSDAWVRIYEV
jgi:hypothetical protein